MKWILCCQTDMKKLSASLTNIFSALWMRQPCTTTYITMKSTNTRKITAVNTNMCKHTKTQASWHGMVVQYKECQNKYKFKDANNHIYQKGLVFFFILVTTDSGKHITSSIVVQYQVSWGGRRGGSMNRITVQWYKHQGDACPEITCLARAGYTSACLRELAHSEGHCGVQSERRWWSFWKAEKNKKIQAETILE